MTSRLRASIGTGRRRIVHILRNAFGVYRAHTGTLIATALIIFVPAAVIEALLDSLAGTTLHGLPLDRIVAALTAVGTNTLAYQMFKGVATNASILWRAGDSKVSVGAVLRQLPYVQLVIVDLVLTAGTAVGIALLIVPGLVFGAYFSLAPVLIEMDKINAWAGMKRSAELVRGSFFVVLTLQLVVLVSELALEDLFHQIGEALIPGRSPLGDAVVLGAITAFLASMLVKPIGALAVIELTQELRGAEPPKRPVA